MTKRIILDVDTGTDDAVALMAAALSPEIELVGATTVMGNCAAPITLENTLRVFDHIGLSVPVYAGMSLPMVRPDLPRDTPSVIHGDFLELAPARSAAQPQNAVDWLIETYLASEGEITLVPVGPLTNIAMAMRHEPRILDKIPEIVLMGGAHHLGNVTPSAEFNIWMDPEAARVVIGSGVPLRIVPLDATHKALVSLDDCATLRTLGTPAADAAATFIEQRIDGYNKSQPMKQPNSAPVHDVLAVFAVIDPSILETAHIFVDVETTGELTTGRTVCDFGRRSGKAPNAHFATGVDREKFFAMLSDTLGRRGA